MSVVATYTDRFKGQLQGGLSLVRRRLFGANNEKLDFFMDSFYKLNPNQRTAVLAGTVGVIALFVLGAVALYFSQVASLRSDLESSFAALHELKTLRSAYDGESRSYDKLVDTIDRRTRGMSFKPFFEKIGNDLGVTIEGLSDKRLPLSSDNALSENVQQVQVEMRLPNISVPRLLTFLVEIEKANKFLRVQDLEIRGKFGTKLYFDASKVTVRGYEMSN